jgi:two-component system, NarL family, response regulator NreC
VRQIRLFLVDDHVIFRQSLTQLLATNDQYVIVGEAGDGRQAVNEIGLVKPDIVLLDISMPELNGLETIGMITRQLPDTKVIILSMHDESRYICGALKRGASGYLTKGSDAEELFDAIAQVHAGEVYLGQQINQKVIRDYVGLIQDKQIASPIETLSSREREVLQLVAEGRTGKEIAGCLNISYKTVEHHRHSVMVKLSCDNLSQLIRLAAREGIIST